MAYELSLNKKCHSRDIRSIDYYAGTLVTGGSDNAVKYYSFKQEKLEEYANIDFFEKNILSVKINKKFNSEVFVAVGCADGKIYGLNKSGSPILIIEHNSPISSISFIDNQHIVTGSWDGKGIVWNIATKSKVSEYSNHKYAVTVFYNELTSEVVSGSQDKALAVWNWKTGKQLNRKEGVHGDIIREISEIPGIGFVSCSNDETIKLWTSDLEQIGHLTGHSSFVFTVKSLEFGSYYSAGDDKSIKVWKSEEIIETVQCPASIWSIALDESANIYAGCTDGFLRIFTRIQERKAPLNIIEAFNKEIVDSAAKKMGMSSEEIKKLPTTKDMSKISGKKEGEIRLFKNGLIPEAYLWQNSQWEKLGEVITENNQEVGMVQSKYYPGDKYFEPGDYDHIFDVDDESGFKRQIPFNDGGNALEAAEKFCLREGKNKGYIEQIRKFLMQNSSNIPRSVTKPNQKEIPQNSLKSTPHCKDIQFANISKSEALIKKINEFNSLISGPQKLTDRELEYSKREH